MDAEDLANQINQILEKTNKKNNNDNNNNNNTPMEEIDGAAIFKHELSVLQTIKFSVNVFHPYHPLDGFVANLQVSLDI